MRKPCSSDRRPSDTVTRASTPAASHGARSCLTHREGRVRALVGVALTALGLAVLPGTPSSAAAPYDPTDPSTWSNGRLAAQLTFTCVPASDWRSARAHAAAGVGGVTLLGDDASPALASQMAAVRAAAPAGVAPYVASDEEGGRVQRLAQVIHPLPSAKVMGTWPTSRIESTAYGYGTRMRALGVHMDFGPVADLGVAGYYIEQLGRAFSSEPTRVATASAAWSDGMQRAGVVPVVKHWPGHGQATDSHTTAPTVPPLRTLERRDMVPFDAAFARGVPMVMVGHLKSAGLTEPGLPTSLSPNALRYLRGKAGPSTVIITDSLSMAGSSSALGISPATAAVRSLTAGADWALACSTSPTTVITAIRGAIDTGSLPRAQAVASARRILALKTRSRLVMPPGTIGHPQLLPYQYTRLARGATGPAVVALQRRLGVDPTGSFGRATQREVEAFQDAHGLTVNGVVTTRVWWAMTR